ncbi:MAG: hypothetical protein GWP08_05055 [Nitrospiraceae bacterium]|nr:hypothetical protein [Nitrospiraceae bacterium]
MTRGDHIRVRRRRGYWHHGIDCGDGTVIHYAGEPFRKRHAVITRTSYAEFVRDNPVKTVRHGDADDPDTVLERATGRLGEACYHVVFNNCEHFARWCATGRHESKQIVRALRAAGAVCLAAGVVVTAAGVVITGALARRLARRRP